MTDRNAQAVERLAALLRASSGLRAWEWDRESSQLRVWEGEPESSCLAWEDLLHILDAMRLRARLEGCWARQEPFVESFLLPASRWGWRSIRIEAQPAEAGCQGLFFDATSECEAHRQARLSAFELDAFFEYAPAAMAMFDVHMRYLKASRRWLTDYGLEGVNVLGASHYDIFPDMPERWKEIHQRCLQGAVESKEEDLFAREGGFSMWLKWEVRPWYESTGKIGGLLMLTENITARKQTEQALRDVQHVLQIAVDSMPQRAFWKDREGRYLGCNRSFAIDAGFSEPAELIGKSDFDMPWAVHGPRYVADDREVMRTGEASLNFEEPHGSQMSARWARTSKIPLRDARGEVIGVMGIFEDITAERAAKEELRVAKEAAETALRTKTQFLAHMSHEIRTPMHGILGMADLALSTELNTEQREYVEAVKAAAKVLLTIINDILDFSKLEAGKLRLAPTAFELKTFLGDTLRLIQADARRKGIRFEVAVTAGTPPFWMGDDVRLGQIVSNLASNAIKFTPEGGCISVEVTGGASGLAIAVSDSGIGICKDKQSAIFDAFTQADSSTTKQFGGTGLGLSISRQLTGMMNGTLEVESELGKGSRFTARLGIHPVVEAAPQPVQPSSALAPAAEGLHVLLVEDNAVNQRLGERLLAREGATVEVCGNGREALGRLELPALREACDLVLLDCHMPELNGWDTAREIRRREQAWGGRLPVIALTASVVDGDRERCLEAGMDDFLEKPIDIGKLRAVLQRFRPASRLQSEVDVR